jgi:hypothetical protein
MITTNAIRIEPDGIYDDALIYGAIGVSAVTLAHARRDGSLRFVRKGKRVLYLGQWVMEWLSSDPCPERTVPDATH